MTHPHKLHSLEGLRGVAAFLVVIHHLRQVYFPSVEGYFPTLLWTLLLGITNGTFAVWIFWVMSSFVLSIQFFQRAQSSRLTHSAHDYLEEAALRRYPRLALPVLASVIFAFVVFKLGLIKNSELLQYISYQNATGYGDMFKLVDSTVFGAVKSALWTTFVSYDAAKSYNDVLWTMEIEFIGSLIVFAFLALFGHRRSRFLVYPVMFIVFYRLYLHGLNAFVAGMLLCDLFVNGERLPKLGNTFDNGLLLFLIMFSTLYISGCLGANYEFAYQPPWVNLLYIVIASALIMLTLANRQLGTTLAKRPFAFLGKISFGLYLIHGTILWSMGVIVYLAVLQQGHYQAAIYASLAVIAFSLTGGYLFYKYVDQPSIHLSKYLSGHLLKGAV